MSTESKPPRSDLIWLLLLAVAGVGLSGVLASSVFDFTVSLSGILCVGLIAIGRREGYLIGLYNSITYAMIAYANGLFGEMYLNLLFYLPTGIIGYWMWKRHMDGQKTVSMLKLSWTKRGVIAALCVLSTLGLGFLLGLNPQQNTPYVDATTNTLSVIATFLMMWRFMEQWFLYISLNVLTIIMWSIRFADGSESSGLMILMWTLYLLNAVFGAWRWHTGSKESSIASPLADS